MPYPERQKRGVCGTPARALRNTHETMYTSGRSKNKKNEGCTRNIRTVILASPDIEIGLKKGVPT